MFNYRYFICVLNKLKFKSCRILLESRVLFFSGIGSSSDNIDGLNTNLCYGGKDDGLPFLFIPYWLMI